LASSPHSQGKSGQLERRLAEPSRPPDILLRRRLRQRACATDAEPECVAGLQAELLALHGSGCAVALHHETQRGERMAVRLRDLAGLFLKIGTIAVGGPAAHIAMMEDERVRPRQWMGRQKVLDLLGFPDHGLFERWSTPP